MKEKHALTSFPGSLILRVFPFLTVNSLVGKCEEMLNHPERCSPVRRVLIFGLLFGLCVECGENDHPALTPGRHRVLASNFLAKLEAAISELRLFMTPDLESVTALIIAVCYT